jgi:glycosyltransferase involved in cell wall biosynthesis
LRQIHYLAQRYDLTVIGYGEPDPSWPQLVWRSVPEPHMLAKVAKLVWYVVGRLWPQAYDAWFWSQKRHQLAYQFALASGADAIHANDWQALPIAARAAARTGARVVLHMHEYAEEERSDHIVWRILVSPAIRFLIRQYVALEGAPVDASITVCEMIAARYRRELGLDPVVVMNAPSRVELPPRSSAGDPRRVRMIHHGYAKRGRGLHELIQVVARTDQRFTLDFMLVEDDGGYIDELKRLAQRIVPGRVFFRDPVKPGDIVRAVAEYDMGLSVIQPTTYNNLAMLPNKFFEYVQAGLAVCVGPSPAMAHVVTRFGFGLVASSFNPRAVATCLNQLGSQDLQRMQAAARKAATVLNAEVEMGKILALYDRLLANGGPNTASTVGGQPWLAVGGR